MKCALRANARRDNPAAGHSLTDGNGRHLRLATTHPPETWNDFARLVEANNGVRGGRWCMAFPP
jgi:hypothetical protein